MKEEVTKAQVKRIIESAAFRDSARLQDFLKYIVEEALAGRSARIKGLTVAQAVFSAGKNFDPDSSSIVRVEAGRLRRRLEQYYSTSGRHDPLIISVPKGSYAPAFSHNPNLDPREDRPPPGRQYGNAISFRWAMAGAVAIILFVAWQIPGILDTPDEEADSKEVSSHQNLDSEVEILFQQAFVLLMPPENNARLNAAKRLFQNVIDIESDFAGGYAGKSLSYSIGVLFIKSEDPGKDLLEAVTLARQAIGLDPDFSLGYAALALALSLDSNRDEALENARRAIAIPKRYAITDAMVSLVLLNSDMPQAAIDQLSKARRLNPNEPRTPFLNLMGIAQYVIGDYAAALESFESNREIKGPTGPHMDVFVAATYAQLGKDFQAQAILHKLRETNPDYPLEQWLANYIKSEDKLQNTMNLLSSVGYSTTR
jgi:tetratricopeptide (TPR) repeat protein